MPGSKKDKMETDSNLKTSGRFFSSFCPYASDEIVKNDLASFFFQNSFDFVSLVAENNFCLGKVLRHKLSKFVTKNEENSHDTAPSIYV